MLLILLVKFGVVDNWNQIIVRAPSNSEATVEVTTTVVIVLGPIAPTSNMTLLTMLMNIKYSFMYETSPLFSSPGNASSSIGAIMMDRGT